MTVRPTAARAVILACCLVPTAGFTNRIGPEAELAAMVKAYVRLAQPADWRSLEALPGVRWAPLPPSALQNCAADGGCFARQGAATIAGRPIAVIATGARSMVFNVYLRNGGAPFGEQAVLTALTQAALTSTLVRCPVRGTAGSTNTYRIDDAGAPVAYLAIQAAATRRAGEGFVLTAGTELPKLQPNQLAMYSAQCTAGAAQTPAATSLPHEQVAATVVALLAPGNTSGYDWKTLTALPTGISWDSDAPKRGDLSFRADRNPFNMTGHVSFGGRELSVQASGTQAQVQTIYLDENGMHPRGEHMLGVVYQKGITVQLDHCGPIYTQSTNNWYRLTSRTTRPALIRQSIRYDGTQVQDSYELRLDGSSAARDPRDRMPGSNGCQ